MRRGDDTGQIRPLNSFARAGQLRPRGMTRMPDVSAEEVEALTRIALGIFADMTNAGRSFQDALLAIYLSGLQHGVAALREKEQS